MLRCPAHAAPGDKVDESVSLKCRHCMPRDEDGRVLGAGQRSSSKPVRYLKAFLLWGLGRSRVCLLGVVFASGVCLLNTVGVLFICSCSNPRSLRVLCVFIGSRKRTEATVSSLYSEFLNFLLIISVCTCVWRSETNVWGQFRLSVNSAHQARAARALPMEHLPSHPKERESVFGKVGTILGSFRFGTVVFNRSMWG